LIESEGALIVDLTDQNLGIAIMVKSDGGTTYLLRDLAAFIYRKSLGFTKQLYVVDNRQSHSFRQLFAILEKLGEISSGEGHHIDYGFMGFKGEALSSRKGNMILALDVLDDAQKRVASIIAEKNPDLRNKTEVERAVALGAVKYFILSHNRHSDIEFDWEEALSFDGNSGPYLQYVHARLASILRKESGIMNQESGIPEVTETERRVMVELTKFNDVVEDSINDYMPNILANYLFGLASLLNKFYHESPVLNESDSSKKQLRLTLVKASKNILAQGLDLLGIRALEEM
jgi:arginyl-tRNA synthetase